MIRKISFIFISLKDIFKTKFRRDRIKNNYNKEGKRRVEYSNFKK